MHFIFKKESIIRITFSALFLLISIGMNAQKKVSFSFENVPVKTVLNEITKQTGYTFVYSDDFFKAKENATLNLKSDNASIESILNQLFKGKAVSYRIQKKQVILAPAAIVPQKSVSGVVKDDSGQVCPGTTIKNEKSGEFTVSDVNGAFSIKANAGDRLTFSFIGLNSTSLTVDGRAKYEIVMSTDKELLEEVVVTGYQTLSKERSAGSFAVVKGNTISDKAKLTGSILGGLEGTSAGLVVSHSTDSDEMLIRGLTSINSTRSPLFVVDGVPLDKSMVEDMLNSNDIVSATVLKDATAASIWGSQAANGVVVITTKNGNKNEKMRVTYDASFNYYGKPDYSYQNKMDTETYLKNAQEMFDVYSEAWDYNLLKQYSLGFNKTQGVPVIFPHEHIMYQYKNGIILAEEKTSQINALLSKNEHKSYEDNFMSNKWEMRHSVSLSGGGNKHTYYMSIGYYGNQGISQDNSSRITINAKQVFQLTRWMNWDMTINGSFTSNKSKVSPWKSNYFNPSNSYYRDIPYVEYSENGKATDIYYLYMLDSKREYVENVTGVDMSFKPADDYGRSFQKDRYSNIRINTGLTIDLLPGLKYEGRFQYSQQMTKGEWYIPRENWLIREEYLDAYKESTGASLMPSDGGNYQSSNSRTFDWTLRNQLTFDRQFNDGKHQVTALAGTEVRKYLSNSNSTYLRGYDYQTMTYSIYDQYTLRNYVMGALFGSGYNTFAYASSNYSNNETDLRYFSLFANGAYTFDHKYSLNASIRMDQSNLFGSNPATQYKPIWSVGASWNMKNENFMKDIDFINYLSVRGSYGFAGNSPSPGDGAAYNLIKAVNTTLAEGIGYYINTPANKKITWEKTRSLNLGFDLRVLDNNLSIAVDYYNKFTKNLLGSMNLNPVVGYASVYGNIGQMKNSGVELTINSNNIVRKNFRWSTNFTFSNNKNKITKLDVASPYRASSLVFAQYVEGYSAGSVFGYRYAGLDSNGNTQVYDKDGNIIAGKNSSTLSTDDLVYKGSYIPKYSGGLTNTFSYKNWDLSFMFVYNLGYKMRKNVTTEFYGRPADNLYEDFDNRWRKPGDELITNVPSYTADRTSSTNYSLYYFADCNVLNASYIKLRDLSLSYHFSESVCRKLSMESMKVTASVGNLFYIAANNEGIDPEAKCLQDASYISHPDKYGANYLIGLTINF